MSCLMIIYEFLRDNHLTPDENPDLPTKRIDIMKICRWNGQKNPITI